MRQECKRCMLTLAVAADIAHPARCSLISSTAFLKRQSPQIIKKKGKGNSLSPFYMYEYC